MGMEKKCPEGSGLVFFGRVNASISHEIKNVLAVINENAGLLEDIVLMAEKGVALPLERLGRLSGTVQKQIVRADGIIKKMNTFAHSADRQRETVDLHEMAAFVTDMCGRMIGLSQVSVKLVKPAGPVTVSSHRFYLQNLLWVCIEAVVKVLKPGQVLQLDFERRPQGAQIRFGFETIQENMSMDAFFPEDAPGLMAYLQADLFMDPDAGGFQICLP